jgi:hypothetical protein
MNRKSFSASPADYRWPPALESADHRISENRVCRPRSATGSQVGRAAIWRTENLATWELARRRAVGMPLALHAIHVIPNARESAASNPCVSFNSLVDA